MTQENTMKNYKTLLAMVLLWAINHTALASDKVVKQWIDAYEIAHQPTATEVDIQNFIAFFADDFTDYHAAYNVTITGKEKTAEGVRSYVARMKKYALNHQTFFASDDVATVLLEEDSQYTKKGKDRHFKGQTLLLIEFDKNQKIKHLRRYLQ